ncbi:uncharacterized protein LOC123263551 [Cotesia glomerata]|uniref:CHK kinase-like domain-containing protein n=1 Tax=Cotesia glomerata TaxID=32391 RepID=A0AAV7IPB4_COTGL|nr:uncharacterized protein LOC123263551 [Cotesia glomerata]KAH0554520.1 hypothetical protein KQX54_011103 [Cotesia glomerata]
MSDSEDTDGSGVVEWPVSKEWLENILKIYHSSGTEGGEGEGPKVTVEDFEVSPGCVSGESVLSDILAVAVDYTLDGEEVKLKVIVKLLPQDPFSRFFVTEAQFDLREIKFYTQVVPDLKAFQQKQLSASSLPGFELPIPSCIHAHYKPAGGTEETPEPPESFLILENLRPRGYEGAEFSRGLTLRQAEAALSAIARLHALSLCLKVKEGRPLSEKYQFLFQTARATDSYQQLVERGLPQLARFLERRPGSEAVLEALLALRPKTKEIIASLLAPEDPLALITHTDFWCNNLLFKDLDDECKCAILDWQMVTYSRPTNDIALLLVSSVPTELRRLHTAALLDKYWQTLLESSLPLGVDVPEDLKYSREDLDKDYRRSQLLALLLCIGSVDVALGDPLTEQRLIDLLEDLHTDGVLSLETANVA